MKNKRKDKRRRPQPQEAWDPVKDLIVVLLKEACDDEPRVRAVIERWVAAKVDDLFDDPDLARDMADALNTWLNGDGTITLDRTKRSLDTNLSKPMLERIKAGGRAKVKAVVEDGKVTAIAMDGDHRTRALNGRLTS